MKTICTKCKLPIETVTCNTCIDLLAEQGIKWVSKDGFLTGHAAKTYTGPLWDVEAYKRQQIIKQVGSNTKSVDQSANNGGSTDYYRIPTSWVMAQDVIEARKMNYSQGNIFKVAFTFNTGRHEATSYKRELNKIIYFAQRELERLKDVKS